MFRDANELSEGAQLQADVCIAGAGAAGITMALQLRKKGLKTIVLESGGLERDKDTQTLYEGTESAVKSHGLSDRKNRKQVSRRLHIG